MKEQIKSVKQFAIAMSKELTQKLDLKVKNSLIREAVSHYFNHHDWNTFIGASKKNQRKFEKSDHSVSLIISDALSVCFDYCQTNHILKVYHHAFSFVSTSYYQLTEKDINMLLNINDIKQIYFKGNNQKPLAQLGDTIQIFTNDKICFKSDESEFEFHFGDLENEEELLGFFEFLRKISGQKFKEKHALKKIEVL